MNLEQRISQLSPQQRKLLELKLKEQHVDILQIPITKISREEHKRFPLSFGQERLWFIDRLEPGTPVYNIAKATRLDGPLNKEILEKSINEIVRRHEIFRVTFIMNQGESAPAQVILPELYLPLDVIDFKNTDEEAQETAIKKYLQAESQYSFDLAAGPLLKPQLLELAEQKHIFLLLTHHIIADGISVQLFLNELVLLYEAFSRGREFPLPALPLQYVDYCWWQRQWFQGGTDESEWRKRQEAYWLEQFAEEVPALMLPLDYQRPMMQSFAGNTIYFMLESHENDFLKVVALKEKVTTYVILLTVFNIFLAKLSGMQDIVVGTPVTGRHHRSLQNLIGMFVNTLALRNRPYGDKSIGQFLREVKDCALKAIENQDYPYEDIVNKIKVGRNSLFNVMFALEKVDNSDVRIPGLTLTEYNFAVNTAKFDLTLIAREEEGTLHFSCEYCTKLFKEETIRRFIAYFKQVIDSLSKAEDFAVKISEIEILTDDEKKNLLNEFNNIEVTYPKDKTKDKTISQLFEEQATKSPDRIALSVQLVPRVQSVQLTYFQVNEKSGRLAGCLIEKGIMTGDIVALMTERSSEMIIGILGILKSGAAYLPIDPQFPQERIDYMLKDSAARILLTDYEKKRMANCQLSIVNCELSMRMRMRMGMGQAPFRPSHPGQLAYIIYTSGTTGMSKGCMITQRNVISLLKNPNLPFEFSEYDNWTMFHQYYFDFSVWEMYGALFNGARLIMIPQKATIDLEYYLKILKQEQVTILNQTPSVFYQLSGIETAGKIGGLNLRYIIFGGEALHPAQLKQWREKYPAVKFINMFGITETTVHVTHKEIGDTEIRFNISNIGKPLTTLSGYVVDPFLNPLPCGIPGELLIAGEGLARGYLNRPELTAEKFLINKSFFRGSRGAIFSKKAPLIYRSGDLVKKLPKGELEYLGRIDHQVKIRGFRIELGEIEARLLKHPKIKEAVVTLAGDKQDICAYYTSDMQLPVSELRRYMAAGLPNYMIPAYFILLEKIPLTINGKIDKKRLPAPGSLFMQETDMVPQGDTEKTIAAIWKEVLKLDNACEVGIDMNFFEIGGNSLNIIDVHRRINQEFNKELPIIDMFHYTTIRTLARFLAGTAEEKVDESLKEKKTRTLETDIAVIGMAGRFPGAKNIHEFWENLKNGVESITFFNDDELDKNQIAPRLLQDPHYVKANGILPDYDHFDAAFFGYSPREAGIMDPQVRILHECAWSALEDAGYNPYAYNGSIGLYAGAMENFDWETRVRLSGKAEMFGEFAAKQLINKDFISMRISYKLNLKGPVVFVQTACSTSLVAIHLACRALQGGECDMALAGGVSVTLFEKCGYLYQDGLILSPDGHCRPFDAKAKGTVGGNGAGLVALKPLANAVADRDHIYAIVKGSAINNDGLRKVGFTAPSIEGQAEAIRAAHQAAGIEPGTIGYVETHGTGTELGDPVEIRALKLAFNTDKRNYCALGSVKSNLGHLDAAAGAAGFIKTVWILHSRLIPPSLHFETPNPKIDFENSPFYVNAELRPWQNENENQPLRACVSSFGMGGTNAHVVLEEYAPGGQGAFLKNRPLDPQKTFNYLLLLSAKTKFALEQQTLNLTHYFEKNPGLNLGNAAYTLQVGRACFDHRKIIVCNSTQEKLVELSVYNRETGDKPVVFMFPGQGSQYVNMGLELYRTEPVFRREMDQCFEILLPITGYDIKDIIYPGFDSNRSYKSDESNIIDQTEITQPLIFTIEYALAKSLMAWGIKPQAMIGHSIGEYVAACLAGVFSLADALQIVALRGRLMGRVPTGAMLSVSLSENELIPLLQTYPDAGISLAAVNGPFLCTVSGPHEDIAAFARQLAEKNIQCKLLHTSHAFHSHMMEPIRETFTTQIRDVPLNSPAIPYQSNLTGCRISLAQVQDPAYWGAHLRKTVRFNDGLGELMMKTEKAVFIEVGPGNALSTFAGKNDAKKPGHLLLNLLRHPREDISDKRFLLTQLGRLWLYNVPIQWPAYYESNNVRELRRIPLPTYPFEPTRYPADKGLANLDEVTVNKINQKGFGLSQRKKDLDDWFYVPQWTRSTLPQNHRVHNGTPLIFMDDTGLGPLLVKALEKEEKEKKEKPGLIVVKKGRQFSKTHGENNRHAQYIMDPGNPEHYGALFRELQTTGNMPAWIIHLWNVTANVNANVTECDLAGDFLETGFYSLIWLAQSIGKIDLPGEIHIDVITDHLHEVTGGDGNCPEKAVVLGPVQVIPREYPHIRCRAVDISRIEAAGLLLELTTESPDPVIALRGNYRWVPSFEPLKLEKPLQPRLKEKGVYLITGGLGGIGLTLAEHLVKAVGARVILTGRSNFPGRDLWSQWLTNHDESDVISQKIRKIQTFENLGGEVVIYNADVAEEKQMRSMIHQCHQRFGAIDGVIHAAGLADGAMIQRRSRHDSDLVLDPKVKGTLLLNKLLKDQPLDFFVLCSSLASFRAPFGQVAYCSANAFLDAFAHYKSNGGESGKYWGITTSINWDSWHEVGMAAAAVKKLSKAVTISLEDKISPTEGAAAFDRITALRLPQVVVSVGTLPFKISTPREREPGEKESFAYEDSFPTLKAKEPKGEKAPCRRPDLDIDFIGPGNSLEKTIADVLQDFLGIEKVGVNDNFFELGISSLDLVQISRRLKETLKEEIAVVTFFTYSSVRALSQFIQSKHDEKNKEKKPEHQASESANLLEDTISLLENEL